MLARAASHLGAALFYKIFYKFFLQKPVDICEQLCYNNTRRQEQTPQTTPAVGD